MGQSVSAWWRSFTVALRDFSAGFTGSVSGGCWGLEMPPAVLRQVKEAKGFTKKETVKPEQEQL